MLIDSTMKRANPALRVRVLRLLESLGRNSLSMGQIIERLDLDKTQAGEVSSLLFSMRARGDVECFDGPADAKMGPRIVRRYRWVLPVGLRAIVEQGAVGVGSVGGLSVGAAERSGGPAMASDPRFNLGGQKDGN